MTVSPAVRVLRAAVFAAMCVTLAAAAHQLGTGAAPSAWAESYGFLGVLGLACPLSGRERSLTGIAGTMLSVQVALHVAFDAAGSGPTTMSMPGMRMGAPYDGHAMTAQAAGTHLLAALLAAWWLHRGEAAFWSLIRRRTEGLLPGLSAWWRSRTVPGIRMPRVAGRPSSHLPPVRQPLLRHALSRRGPPTPAPPPVPYA